MLKDLAKFENDLLYLLTPIDASQLLEALAITSALRSVADLQADLGPSRRAAFAQFVRAEGAPVAARDRRSALP